MKENIFRMSKEEYQDKKFELRWCVGKTISKSEYKGLLKELKKQYEGKRTRYELGLD